MFDMGDSFMPQIFQDLIFIAITEIATSDDALGRI